MSEWLVHRARPKPPQGRVVLYKDGQLQQGGALLAKDEFFYEIAEKLHHFFFNLRTNLDTGRALMNYELRN